MIVHLIDGTYELFRHFYGGRRRKGPDLPMGAVAGVLHTVAQMLEGGATHIGVATDHVIESFRNELWPDYKTGEGIEWALRSQFVPLEEALAAMGVTVWPMVELEADDALASAAYLAAKDERVDKVCIWTPDKDLAQCVADDRIVQVDRKSGHIRDAAGVRAKFGVPPALFPTTWPWWAMPLMVTRELPDTAPSRLLDSSTAIDRWRISPSRSSEILVNARSSINSSPRSRLTPRYSTMWTSFAGVA